MSPEIDLTSHKTSLFIFYFLSNSFVFWLHVSVETTGCRCLVIAMFTVVFYSYLNRFYMLCKINILIRLVLALFAIKLNSFMNRLYMLCKILQSSLIPLWTDLTCCVRLCLKFVLYLDCLHSHLIIPSWIDWTYNSFLKSLYVVWGCFMFGFVITQLTLKFDSFTHNFQSNLIPSWIDFTCCERLLLRFAS